MLSAWSSIGHDVEKNLILHDVIDRPPGRGISNEVNANNFVLKRIDVITIPLQPVDGRRFFSEVCSHANVDCLASESV